MPAARGAAGIAVYLRQAIRDGVYLYGDRLPAERRLAASFASSRGTVREALRVLEQENLLTRRVGSGTYVSYRPAAVEGDVAEITSPLELIEVRLAVEPDMTRLATVNATARDIEHMAEVLARLEASGADANHFSAWDQQFHQSLANATGNPLLASLYRQINQVRGHAQWRAMKDKILTPARIDGYNRQHRALYEALMSRDVETAVRVITEHLEDARRDLLAV
ncbi:MAG: FadR/GntR family transcriptional regulator [Kiloniellales bacterium]